MEYKWNLLDQKGRNQALKKNNLIFFLESSSKFVVQLCNLDRPHICYKS